MFFCKHSWEVVVDKEFPSAFEQMIKATQKQLESLKNADEWFFDRKYLLVMKCTKCGKVKTIRS